MSRRETNDLYNWNEIRRVIQKTTPRSFFTTQTVFYFFLYSTFTAHLFLHSGDLSFVNFNFQNDLNFELWRFYPLKLNMSKCTQYEKFPKILPILLCFSLQNWRVIFEVFQSNFGFAWLNSTVRCLVWKNEQKSWEIFTSSLRSHILKSRQFCGISKHCASIFHSNGWFFMVLTQ